MTTLTCQRCGFIAKNEAKLVKHWRTELQCPAIHCKIPHTDLINLVRPQPSSEQRTCPHCNNEFKSITGMKNHVHKCKSKAKASDTAITNTNVATTSTNHEEIAVQETATLSKKPVSNLSELRKQKNPYANVDTPKKLHAFTKDINWNTLQLQQQYIIDLCRKTNEGIIDMFIDVHNCEEHDNIRLFHDEKQGQQKIIIYDGSKWIEMQHKHIIQHLWFIFAFLEEQWCDYQSAIRCNALSEEQILSDDEQKKIEDFYYDMIVDEESIYFYCKDIFNEYIEALKNNMQ